MAKGKRKGLRSQRKTEEEYASDEGAAASVLMEERATSKSMNELLGVMKDFMAGQKEREEGLLNEVRNLRGTGHSSPSAEGPSSESPSSPRFAALPTPGAASRRPQGESTTLYQPPEDDLPRLEMTPPVAWRPYAVEPKIPPFQMGEDIENYLLRFERIAKTWKWPETEWACRLVPLLSGKALEAYTAMDEDEAHCYADLKAALLVKFDISPETYRQQFRCPTAPAGESPTETYHRLKSLYRRWIRPDQLSKEQIGELIIMEQLLRVLPPDVRTWVREHEPEDGLTAAKLALQHQNARRGGPPRFSGSAPRTSPHPAPPRPSRGPSHDSRGNPGPVNSQPAYGKPLVCFYCQQQGHKASVCPVRRDKLTGACYAPRGEGDLCTQGLKGRTFKTVTLNGQPVTALLDSGSFTSLVKKDFVPLNSIDYGSKTDILCVHGDSHAYPKAEVTVAIDSQPYLLTVAVVENLPVDLVLGTDLPVLLDLLHGEDCNTVSDSNVFDVPTNVSCPVVTRSQAKTGVEPLPDLGDDLFEGGTKGPKKSKRQRRFEKQLMVTGKNKELLNVDEMWNVPDNIAELQRQDETLKTCFEKVDANVNANVTGKEKFVLCDGILYISESSQKRLVVPAPCRQLVLRVAHTLPWAGHFGRHKTYLRVSARFYWPGMYQDIQSYCATCPTCQKTAPNRKSDRAVLHPLPVISTPFRRIAMDIVGPLVKSARGHEYILVLCDYATRYPEAFPLRTITAPAVLRSLVQFFSRVGIPDEILTDQGTNFTSRLLQLFHKQLGITALRTTPYHPQTDGLVERFNQTLKRMLQKFVSDTGKDWDQWLPFVLFAYREVPQSSTGFSPFELLYGWDVQGPLDLLNKTWTATEHKPGEQGIVQFVLQMRDRLSSYREEAEENLREAQRKQKTWYDQQARQRDFEPGQKVLLLLPSSNSKLLAKWQGPYTITRRMGPVTYEIHHPDKKKPRQTYHVNLLKAWREAPAATPALLVRQVEVEEEEDPGVPVVTKPSEPLVAHLSADQAADLRQIFREVPSLFAAEPGKTTLIEHVIRLKDRTPFRQRPYRVPQQLVAQLRQEIESMLELGVIEPSTSEWCSPVVIVFKKNGTLRICIDFRKLNSISEFDAYPMPRIDDLLDRIGSAAFITTLDLCKGYWQVPLDAASRPYTAFRTPAGLFQFTVMPFGLHGAPATFQRLMDRVLQGCEEFCAAYLDDVVIFSDSWEQHLQHLSAVLEKIRAAGLTLNVSKCEWARRDTRYLGYQLGGGEVRPQVDKVEAILKCPRPQTKKEVRSFLGLAGWYRRFVPQFATLAAPLTALTTKGIKNPVPWTDECEQSFCALKSLLCSSPVLRSPDFSRRFLVQVDASEVGLGAVLAQGEPGAEQPILYLSRKLLPREARYSVVEKEGLAIKWALESLRYYLLGREFDLETDHRALSWINSMKDHNARLTRWYLSLQPFKFVIRHRSGKSNLVADYLSRLPRLGQPPGGEGWCDGAGPSKPAVPVPT